MNQTNRSLEQMSALADGQLQGEDFARAVGELATQDALRESWRVYHLVGEVLRSGTHTPCSDSGAFMARLRQRLAAEAAPRPTLAVVELAERNAQPAEPANEPVFRWKMAAGAATIAAVAAIGWTWMGQGPASAVPGAQLAQQQAPAQTAAPVLAGAEDSVLAVSSVGSPAAQASRTRVMVGNGNPQLMLRDPRLDELLEAHQQAGGASQMPSGFLRNATFEGQTR